MLAIGLLLIMQKAPCFYRRANARTAQLTLPSGRTMSVLLAMDSQVTWILLKHLTRRVLPKVSQAHIQRGLRKLQPQKRRISRRELRGVPAAQAWSTYASYIFVELQGACSLVEQLTGNLALAQSLAAVETTSQNPAANEADAPGAFQVD